LSAYRSGLGSVSRGCQLFLGVLVQCVRSETLVGANRALDGDVVEENLVGHGAGEVSVGSRKDEHVYIASQSLYHTVRSRAAA